MKKSRKVLIYVLTVIISFLTIPEIVLRTVSGETLVMLSRFTSLGGLFSPFLSVMIFIGLASILVAIIGVYVVSKIYQGATRVKDK
ncbi:membrane protein [Phytobacter ursingii]|mgnify:CR=1 FL=1|nr:membrane protein [Phytobacter ursingii]